MLCINDLLPELRPRERLMEKGAKVLSDAELLAILLRTGSREKNAIELATYLLSGCGGLFGLFSTSFSDLTAFHGIGEVKASQFKACLELASRLSINRKKTTIKTVKDAFLIVSDLRFKSKEFFVALLLDSRGRFLGRKTICSGGLNTNFFEVRDVFEPAIKNNAAGMILVHNHPSGNPEPSNSDVKVTLELIKAGELLGVVIADHLVVGCEGVVSMRERGLFS